MTFLDRLLFGKNKKDAVMQPIPPHAGIVKTLLVRDKTGLKKLSPEFYLKLEKSNGGNINFLYAKKVMFNKSAYYLISLDKAEKRDE